MLRNEAAILQRLARLELGYTVTPTLLYAKDAGGGVFHLVQSSCKGHLSSVPLIPDERHRYFLDQIRAQTMCKAGFLGSACHQEVSRRIKDIGCFAEAGQYRLMCDAYTWSSHYLEGEHIGLHLAHRDFTPWNTFVTDGRLYVFDWEFARAEWAPMCDAFHFIMQKGILVDRCSANDLWRRLTSDTTHEGRFITQCAVSIHATKKTVLALLAFYLCDMMSMYLFHYSQEGAVPSDGKLLLGRWESILQKIYMERDVMVA
jgi:hypothetical protein